MKLNSRSIAARIIATAFALSGLALTGCGTPGGGSQPRVQRAALSCRLPVVTPLPETKQAQEKGGLEIAMVPATYKAVRSEKVTIRPVEPTYGEQLGLGLTGGMQGRVFVEKTTTPQLTSDPERLQFTVRINNKLARVFRGQGSVVQFNVAGKLVPFGDTDYKAFINGIVPPRNETQLNISGPLLDVMPAQGTIGIYLYDVVTATDTAGNVTEKQNYEWFFSYVMESVKESAEITTVRGPMGIADYQNHVAHEQQQLLQQRMQKFVPPTQP